MSTDFTAGVYLRFKYIAPRKRKAVNWGISGESLDAALIKASEWLSMNKGRFLMGWETVCQFYDVADGNGRGDTIRMQTVPMRSVQRELGINEINFVNGESK